MRAVPGKIKQGFVTYKTPIVYASSSIIKAFATMLVGFIIAKYISPQDLGLWTTITLALTYSSFLQGGIINGLNLELPYAFGSGDDEKGKKLAGITQTFTLISSIIILLIGLSCLLFYPTNDDKIRYGILGITFVIILTYYQSYLLSTFRSNNSFLKLSYIQLSEAIFNVFTLVFVLYFAYYGMIIKSVTVLGFFVFLLHINRPIKALFYWDKKMFISLLKVGFPIFALVVLDSFATTIDKVWLLKYTDLTQVGLYSFGLYALNTFILFSSSIASYIYPKLTFEYAKNNDKIILWKYVKKITILLLAIQTPILILCFFLVPSLVVKFFPNYAGSLTVIQILLTAGVLKGSVIGVNVLWSMKSWKYMYMYQIIYTLMLISITFICMKLFSSKIEGVAYGVLIANALNLINALILSYKATHIK